MSSTIACALPRQCQAQFLSALAPMDEDLLGLMETALAGLARETPNDVSVSATQAAVPRCSDGHELCRFSPQVDGFCCEECGDDLCEGGQYLRCDGCGGLTYCYNCVGCASPPSQTALTNAHQRKTKVSKACQQFAPKSGNHDHAMARPRTIKSLMTESDDELALALACDTSNAKNSKCISSAGFEKFKDMAFREDDLELAIALSISEAAFDNPNSSINGCDSTLQTASMVNSTFSTTDPLFYDEFGARSFDSATRCYVCGSFTKSPLRLEDPECPHVACTLDCYISLHPKWLDVKYELLELDKAFP